MLILPVPWHGKLKLLVVLEDENVERIKEHDCAEIVWRELPPQYINMPVDSVTIGYVTKAERDQMLEHILAGEMPTAIEMVVGGFKYRPDLGDGAQPTKVGGPSGSTQV